MAFINHSQVRSAVNSSPIAPKPRRIRNRVYRRCAKDGFDDRMKAELAGEVPAQPRLYSHHSTRQYYFNIGWQAVTEMHILRAKQRQQAQPLMRSHLGASKQGGVQ
ncbi:hypothetical protein [Shewanella sp. KCT]|uniref:hypothetical protein n=1 Tax=Shewanella sp. KCT TaxID=2569535 RepID=UPI00118264CC|nr:hypothetical protein [Shewanella sp. KCT]TVP15380.1 hypothetical protein AYI87_06860 [Shewanella sp. KCT]